MMCLFALERAASADVQTDGAMFIAGMSSITEAPYNDVWTIPGEEHLSDQWKKEDKELFETINPMEHFHQLQVQNFCESILDDCDLMIPGEEGRKTVELITAIYRSMRDNSTIKFPLQPEFDRNDFDGRYLEK